MGSWLDCWIVIVKVTGVGFGADLRNQLDQFQDGSLKITNASVTFITALTKNGISGNTTLTLMPYLQ